MATVIQSNGSRWIGEAPASIDELFEVLAEERLDERRAPFIQRAPLKNVAGKMIHPDAPQTVRICGNFLEVSHVFSIDTDDKALIARFEAAITANQKIR